TEEGTPQGGVISPLLANITLHGIEEMLTKNFSRRTGKTSRKRKPSFVRYADDFVLMDESLEVVLLRKQLIETWLSEMGLVLKESKTRITHTFMKYEEKVGFDFLGFHIRQLLIKQEKKCSECHLMFTSEDIMEVHHIDQNRGNNKLSNLTLVHRHCHDIIH
nr:hypothetical protein - Calothrix sp [Calothrix sp.]